MAREKTARERDSERQLLDRRSYLRLAGTAAATVAAAGVASNTGASAEYDTITVSAGETRSFDLGSGDTLENTLIDITASGAQYRIQCSGDGWAIRNVGVKGHFDASSKFSPFIVQGNGTIENLYLGDGGGGETTGIFVYADHAGEIAVDRLNVQGWPDNGIYGSAPGNSSSHGAPGGGGTVKISNSYGANCGSANFRLGTTGSYCQNCVSVGGDRAFWGYYEETEYRNCDASGAGEQFRAGASAWEKGQRAVVVLENCRASGTINAGPGTVNGSPGSNPRTSPPDGVPTSAEAAASGSASSGGSDGSGSDGSGDQTDQSGTVLELVAGSNVSNATYEFTVEGSVEKRTDAGDNSAESGPSDSITDNGDGTVTVSGIGGNGYGDSYLVDGVVTAMNLDESQWTLRWDGSEVAVDDVVLSNTLVIDGSDTPHQLSTYEFSVSGRAVESATLGSINAYDEAGDGTISGRVIGGTDGYRFSGELTGFSLDGPARVDVEDGG